MRARPKGDARRRTDADDAPIVGIGILASLGVVVLVVVIGVFIAVLAMSGN